jgi:hypothetical protein
MPFGLPGELVSLAFLAILLAAAFVVAGGRERPDPARALPPACLALALQALHVGEEFGTGFQWRAPALFGLPPWSPAYFVWVNLAAIALWLLALRSLALGRTPLPAATLLWFLAIASIGNAVWHPVATLATGAYFPGTVTALLLGAAGYRLAGALTASPKSAVSG